MGHREKEHGERQRRSDPKTAGHIAKLRVFFVTDIRAHRFECHAALRTIAGMFLLHFGVHGAGKNSLSRHPCGVSLERHAAFRTIARLVRFHAGTHRAKVFRRRRWFHLRITIAVSLVPSATTAFRFRRRSLGEKRPSALLAAKIENLPIALGVQRGSLVHSHFANWVFGHIKSLFIPPPYS